MAATNWHPDSSTKAERLRCEIRRMPKRRTSVAFTSDAIPMVAATDPKASGNSAPSP